MIKKAAYKSSDKNEINNHNHRNNSDSNISSNTLCALIIAIFNWHNGAQSSEIGKIVHKEMYECLQNQSPNQWVRKKNFHSRIPTPFEAEV